jgi:diamine N-acetyltransferase
MILKQGEKVILRKTLPEECKWIEEAESHPENSPFVGHWSLEDHRESCSNPDHLRITILDSNQEFAGFVILRGMSHFEESMEIKRIVITKKGMGFGRETLGLLQNLAFEDYKTKHLFLSTRSENVRAIHLYHSVGFIPEADKPVCFHMQREDYDALCE